MKIVAVHKFNGKITEYKLENGKVIDTPECIQLVKEGKIEGCNIGVNRQGEEFVRSNRGTKSDYESAEMKTEVKAEEKVVEKKPRKSTKKEQEETQTTSVADSVTPKRRGRPRKVVETTKDTVSATEPASPAIGVNLNDLPTF